ncbi:MAG: immune inhibitor A [Candidatus Krumholzibacteriota bacterium]|nr:immune inhibitor A [Candidatus Krumholzibacteriota bacterium]
MASSPCSCFARTLAAGLAAALLLAAAAALAADIPTDARGLPLWEEKAFTDFPVRILLDDAAALEELLARVPVASFHREQVKAVPTTPLGGLLVFEPRVTETELKALEDAGYDCARLPDLEREARKAAERAWADQAARGGDAFTYGERGVYHTHAQIGAILAQTEIDHPTLARDCVWGYSVQGRELWGIVISDNVQVNEAEPEVRLSSTMHGDEPPGTEMLLFWVDYLTDNYGQPGYEDVTYLVDNYEIHIMPMHNPDGYVAHERENANGVDLNRNFPEPVGDHPTQEIETIHFMDDALAQHFVVSGNMHTGALVVNYPWDYTPDPTPDEAAIIELSLEYSTYNLPMYNGNWPQGITNGWDWYWTHGCLQDWSYYITDCIDVTIEIYNTKWPSATALDGLWDDNRESLMHYAKAARYGVNGVVTSSSTGLPLNATVTVTGNAKSVHTDPANGDYYKLLDDGTYTLTFEAYGYDPLEVTGVSTTWGTPTVLDVQLDPFATGVVSGVVTGGGSPVAATLTVTTYPGGEYVTTAYSEQGAGGAYSVELAYGDYNFHVACDDYLPEDRVVTVDAATETEHFLLIGITEIVLFEDDFEGGAGGWTGDWSIVSNSSHSPTHAMHDSPGGDYANSVTLTCTMAQGVDLTTLIDPELRFWAHWEIESDWDCVQLEITTNGGASWTAVATSYTHAGSGQGTQPAGEPVFEGTQGAWVENVVDLAAFSGEDDVRFRFQLRSDSSSHGDGFYFDDLVIKGINVTTPAGPAPPAAAPAVAAFPNPFNPKTTLRFTLTEAGEASLAVFDVHGRRCCRLVAGTLPAGEHAVDWDGRDDAGRRLASGVYLVRLESGGACAAARLVLLK